MLFNLAAWPQKSTRGPFGRRHEWQQLFPKFIGYDGKGQRKPQHPFLTLTQPPLCLVIKLQIMFAISPCFPAHVRVTDGLVTAQTPINPEL